EAYWTEDAPAVEGELVRATPVDPMRMAYPSERELLAVEVPGGVTGERPARSAYLFTAERNGASRLAYQLMAAGYRVSSATRPIGAGGRKWPRGTYVVRVSRNDSTLHADIDRLARESGVEVTGIGSAYTDPEMQYGTGSEVVVELKTPRIALVGDEGIGQTSYGATWYVLERRYGIKFTPVSTQWIGSGDLSEFNVILVPDASPGALNRIVGKSGADRLRDWVRAGGTLVTMGGATAWAAREDVNLTSARLVGSGDAKDTTGTTPARADTGLAAQARDPLAVTSPSANNGEPQYLPGSHFDVVLDRTHWLTQGYEDPRLTVMLDGSAFLSLSKEGANVGVFPSSGPLHRAGWSWPQNTERLLRGTAFLIDEPTGRGHVVLFTNEPLFRAWWHALDRLVLNAVLLGPGM
ncbi:MAG TPA: hypothetical protein VFS05_07410, partial [Gemmatimonadaceae bacterium]|nr:hypothetical protein [Gemmatimonadaceae bacterium]